jgi:flagellin
MSLGVLNNLNALYAENNLNNTSNSLSTVLQQLSSGSKINSGADDAAGLSLVDGLQANQQALTQSKTNATEGVGLLQVADGALSQVTSLLNRAVTLATEASNGTLNSSQDTAANQEYQSILSEISNIGSTTTYNDTAVFGQTSTNIYTGDSSTAGAAIDDLNIRSLSSSNIGDTQGVMAYSNGQSSVFLNLSSSTKNAQSTDTLNSAGSSTINVNYLVKGANGAMTQAQSSITVGGAGQQPNTVNGLIAAINGAGLGLTATFGTQAQSGVAGGGTQTGIQITGGLVSVGVDPSSSVTSGTLNPSEITNSSLTVGQTITVNTGSTVAASVTIGQSNNTLAGLALAINQGTGGAGGVTATVVYNSTGQATSLQLADSLPTGGALTVTTQAANVVPNALTPATAITSASNPQGVSFTPGTNGAVGVQGTASLSIVGTGSNATTQALTGSITLSNGTNTKTFVMGGVQGVSGNTVTLGSGTSTLSSLAAAISTNLGTTAVASSTGIAITSTAPGTNITEAAGSTLATALTEGVSTVQGVAATSGTDGTTSLAMVGDSTGFSNAGTDALTTGTTLSLTNGAGSTYTFTMGTVAAGAGTVTETTGGLTTGALLTAINSTTATSGMSAAITGGKIVISSNQVNTSITAVSGLTGASATFTPTGSGVGPVIANQSAVTLTTGIGAPATGQGSLTGSGTTLTGDFSVTNNGNTTDFIMSTGAGVALGGGSQTLSAANSNMAGLMAAINADAGLDLNATLNQTAGGAVSGLTLTATNGAAAAITTGGTGVTAANSLAFTTPVEGGSGQAQSALLALQNNGVIAQGGTVAEDGTLTGSISITTTTGGHTVTDTFNMGNSTANTPGTSTANGTYNIASNKLSDLLTAINTAGTDNLNLTATQDAGTGGLFLQSKSLTDTNMGASSNTLSTSLNYSASAASAVTYTPAVVVDSNGGTSSANDLLTQGTKIVLTNSATGAATTFLMGGVGVVANQVNVGTAGNAASQTLGALATAIGQAGLDLSATATSAGLTVTSTAPNGTGTITVGTNTLTDNYSTGTPTVVAGTGPTSATNAIATINTSAQMSTAGTDALAGQIILTNSSDGTAVTFNMNNNAGVVGNVIGLTSGNSTVSGLMSAINTNVALNMTASINQTTGALEIQSNPTNTTITVGGTGLTDSTKEGFTAGTSASPAGESTGSIVLGGTGNNFTNGDTLTGLISVTADGATTNYVMANNTNSVPSTGTTVHLSAANSNVQGLVAALYSNQGITATGVGTGTLALKSGTNDANAIGISNNNLSDTLGHASATASLGTFASESDAVTGSVNYNVGSTAYALGSIAAMNPGGTVTAQQLINDINTGSVSNTLAAGSYGVNGVTASWQPSGNGTFGSIQLTSNTYGATGNITNQGTGTSITDGGTAANLSYSGGSAYNIGISNVANSGVYDSSISTETAPSGYSAASQSLTANTSNGSGTATISYSDGAGQSLSATDLTNQTDAETSLNALNKAITDVAAQDGYIGAQINTLNAVTQVLGTQQENVESAQNAVQATDYAAATSNMSKYEILSQTGISALAQANSMQQEVTKLLQ